MWLKEWSKEWLATTDKRVFRCYIPYYNWAFTEKKVIK